jgi:excisionase family DNA binding protein
MSVQRCWSAPRWPATPDNVDPQKHGGAFVSVEWLSLGDVARMLGVHPSTVRSWSDQGLLPVYRTQGGHRRYLRSEVELWRQSQRTDFPGEATLVIQNALRNTRFRISEGSLKAESWYGKLDEEARDQYRVSGRELMQRLSKFMTSTDAEAEADALGYEYAARGRRYGLNSAEAVCAFLFFRNVLIESMLTVYESAAVRSPHAWSGMFRKINEFTDRVLLVILETYDSHGRAGR